MTTPAAAACRNHPAREAIGICVECRSRICSECVTKVDGINYCVGCYAALAEQGAARSREGDRPTPLWRARVAAAGLLAVVALMTWGLIEVAFPGGG